MAVFKIIVIYYNFGVPVLARELAMACVCLSDTIRCSVETGGGGTELVLAWMLLSTSPTLCCKEIQVAYLGK